MLHSKHAHTLGNEMSHVHIDKCMHEFTRYEMDKLIQVGT